MPTLAIDVRFGSKPDVTSLILDVCFSPTSGHSCAFSGKNKSKLVNEDVHFPATSGTKPRAITPPGEWKD
jgi:hypothetical protein